MRACDLRVGAVAKDRNTHGGILLPSFGGFRPGDYSDFHVRVLDLIQHVLNACFHRAEWEFRMRE